MRSFLFVTNVFVLISIAVFCTGCGDKEKAYFSGPNVLNNVGVGMQRPGFWISRHPTPDQLILDKKGVARLNRHISDNLKMVRDISCLPPEWNGVELQEKLTDRLKRIKEKRLYFKGSSLVDHSFFDSIEKNMGLGNIASILPVTFGLTVRFTNQRRLPTIEPLFVEPGSSYFDTLQNNGLDIATPLAIVHTSMDKKWLYAIAPDASGWVRATDVGLCSRDTLISFSRDSHFIISLGAKNDIFLDGALTRYHESTRMGTRLPVYQNLKGVVEIKIPVRQKDGSLVIGRGFMADAEVHLGYLPYTSRNIINQAFALLHEPYGWGGMNHNQDCSRFIKEVFATVGINMPRNSKGQAEATRTIMGFDSTNVMADKIKVLQHSTTAGKTLLSMQGHIMLFLGIVDGRPYVIHALWGYRQKRVFGETIRLLNRIVVSDLSLGQGTDGGSLLDRITSVGQVTR